MLTWIVLRAAGIAAYVLLWATVTWGLVGTTGLVGKRVSRATSIAIHQFLATAAFVLLGVHIGGLLLDRFVHFSPLDVAVPMHSSYKAVPVAFGIVALYSLAVVIVSSWARKRLSTKLWRALHLLAVPTFAMALVHGVFTGTDTVRSWMWWAYVATGGSVVFLMLTRALTVGLRPERHTPPAGVTPRARPSGPTAAPVPEAEARRPAPHPSPRPAPAPARTPRAVPARHPGGRPPDAVPVPGPATEDPTEELPPVDPPAPDPPAGRPVRTPQPVSASQAAGVSPAEPPTVVVRVELVVDGERIRDRRRIDVPIRIEPVDRAEHHRLRAPPDPGRSTPHPRTGRAYPLNGRDRALDP